MTEKSILPADARKFNREFYHYSTFLVIFILILAITACSFKTFYNNLDSLIPEYVEGMVNLDEALENKLAQRTTVILNWHRNTQLLQYAEWMREVQQDIGPALEADKVKQRIHEINQFWDTMVIKLNHEMTQLLPLLNKDQIKELFNHIEDNNDKFAEDYVKLDNDERIGQNYDRLVDTYENWIGDLTEQQIMAVKKTAEKLISASHQKLQQRRNWQHGIKSILDQNNSPQKKTLALQEFLTDYINNDPEKIKQTDQKNINLLAKLTTQISHSMTNEQKEAFKNNTNDYIRWFTELSKTR